MDELTFDEFRSILATQDPAKMYVFLTYMFNSDILKEKVVDEWKKVYDPQYIEVPKTSLLIILYTTCTYTQTHIYIYIG